MLYRNRTLEQLMHSILVSQAAMLSAVTQMQQMLLSGMVLRQSDESSGRPEENKPEEVANKAEQKGPQQNTTRAARPKQPQGEQGARRVAAAPCDVNRGRRSRGRPGLRSGARAITFLSTA